MGFIAKCKKSLSIYKVVCIISIILILGAKIGMEFEEHKFTGTTLTYAGIGILGLFTLATSTIVAFISCVIFRK